MRSIKTKGAVMAMLSCNVHIESLLLDLVVGIWQPNPLEEAHLIDHLMTCVYCKIVLAAFVVHMEDDNEDECIEHMDSMHTILALLAKTIHGTST